MKVVIVGSGAQGTGLAGLLAMENDVEQIVLADYSQKALDKAKEQIETLGNRIRTKQIDYTLVNAGDTADVARVIRDMDICFHAILPRFNLPIMKACLQEKVHYLDLISLPYEGPGVEKGETIGAQLELHEAFQNAGLTAVPSVGISPGWTLYAAEKMICSFDEVERVIIRWSDYLDTEEFTSSINPEFMLSEWLGAPHPSAWKNGEIIAEDLLGSEEEFEFPEPIGKRKIYTCTSQPDIMMIPRFSKKRIPYCVEKGGVNLGRMDSLHIWLKAVQQITAKQASNEEQINILRALSSTLTPPSEHDRLYAEGKIRDHATCFSVEVAGYQNGEYIRRIQFNNCVRETAIKYLPWSTPAVYDTVGGLPVILILMIGRGELTQRGVFGAGELHIADRIEEELLARDHDITERIIRENV